jgi:hypothetical protein
VPLELSQQQELLIALIAVKDITPHLRVRPLVLNAPQPPIPFRLSVPPVAPQLAVPGNMEVHPCAVVKFVPRERILLPRVRLHAVLVRWVDIPPVKQRLVSLVLAVSLPMSLARASVSHVGQVIMHQALVTLVALHVQQEG